MRRIVDVTLLTNRAHRHRSAQHTTDNTFSSDPPNKLSTPNKFTSTLLIAHTFTLNRQHLVVLFRPPTSEVAQAADTPHTAHRLRQRWHAL
jgi:hypothetical protein